MRRRRTKKENKERENKERGRESLFGGIELLRVGVDLRSPLMASLPRQPLQTSCLKSMAYEFMVIRFEMLSGR
jgi:hypothetical protein